MQWFKKNRPWYTWLKPKLFSGHLYKGLYKAFLQIEGIVLKWEKAKLWDNTPSYTIWRIATYLINLL